MSEILAETSIIEEADYRPENLVGESLDDRKAELDRVLTSLVSANANTAVKCPWLAGAEVTLSEAMRAYPKPMIEEDPYALAQIVMEMLANPVIDTEENSQQDEEEAEVKKEEVVEQNSAEDVKRPATEKESKKIAEPKAHENAKTSATESEQPNTRRNNQELANDELEITPTLQDINATAAEAQNHAADQTKRSPTQTANSILHDKNEPAQLADAAPLKSTRERLVEEEVSPASTGPVNEPIELPILDTENPISEDVTENVNEVPESHDPNYRIDDESLGELLDEELLDEQPLDEQEPSDPLLDLEVSPFDQDSPEMSVGLMPEPDSRLDQFETVAILKYEFIDEPDRAEDLLTDLSYRIELAEPEVAVIANGLLDKIQQTAGLLVVEEDGNSVNEPEIRDEINELFIELFDVLEIQYTDELIEAMSRMVIISQLPEAVLDADDEEPDETPKDDGTHEVIKNILASRNRIQKAKYYANTIGKSALMLYSNAVLVDGWLAASG